MDDASKPPQFTIGDIFYVVTATCIFVAAKVASIGSQLFGIGLLEFWIYLGLATIGFFWRRSKAGRA